MAPTVPPRAGNDAPRGTAPTGWAGWRLEAARAIYTLPNEAPRSPGDLPGRYTAGGGRSLPPALPLLQRQLCPESSAWASATGRVAGGAGSVLATPARGRSAPGTPAPATGLGCRGNLRWRRLASATQPAGGSGLGHPLGADEGRLRPRKRRRAGEERRQRPGSSCRAGSPWPPDLRLRTARPGARPARGE